MQPINIIGGGMAGCEAAWQLITANIPVKIHEMRPQKKTFAHKTNLLAELVCSNSFRSHDHENNAVGLLHWEMKEANSLIIEKAYKYAVPAGSALAVDRDQFAKEISRLLETNPLVTISREEVTDLSVFGDEPVIVATGPLSSKKLIASVKV